MEQYKEVLETIQERHCVNDVYCPDPYGEGEECDTCPYGIVIKLLEAIIDEGK